MDSGTIIIGGIIVLICIIPVVVIRINNSKKEKQFFRVLSAFAAECNSKISQHDIWNNLAIGIDGAVNMIFHIKKLEGGEVMQQINLAEVEQCRVLKTGNVIEKVELAFTYRNKSREEILVFYNSNHDGLLVTEELRLSEKWCRLINERTGSSG